VTWPAPKKSNVQIRHGAVLRSGPTWLVKCRHGSERANSLAFALHLWAVSHGTAEPFGINRTGAGSEAGNRETTSG
jgi:hypothetical protein